MEQNVSTYNRRSFSALTVVVGWIAAVVGWVISADHLAIKIVLLTAARVLP